MRVFFWDCEKKLQLVFFLFSVVDGWGDAKGSVTYAASSRAVYGSSSLCDAAPFQ